MPHQAHSELERIAFLICIPRRRKSDTSTGAARYVSQQGHICAGRHEHTNEANRGVRYFLMAVPPPSAACLDGIQSSNRPLGCFSSLENKPRTVPLAHLCGLYSLL